MNILIENLIKLGMAVLIGGIIGVEREFRDKAAGFRTLILITVGATLFTIFSISIDPTNSRTRIAANIVTGIGFLGAGAIVREHGRIGGLTTAATIWLAAALGMGIGAGEIAFVSVSAVIVIVVLLVFRRLESWIDQLRDVRSYKIVVSAGNVNKMDKIREAPEVCNLKASEYHQSKIADQIIGIWHTNGSPKNHESFTRMMLKDQEIEEFLY